MLEIFTFLYDWMLLLLWYLPIAGFLIYSLIGLIAKFTTSLVLEGLFLYRVCPPLRFLKLDQPEQVYGFKGAKNNKVISSSGNTLGVWHIPPLSKHDQPLCDATNVVVYCHGNAFHRGFDHRLSLYDELRKAGYHIITFDYSGFGDSTGRPSVRKVVEDALSVYKWTTQQIKSEGATVILWGHSLGTHVSTRALSSLCEGSELLPDALVLEAPFTNAFEASECFPLSKIFFGLYPYLKKDFHDAIRRYNAQCPTDEYLPRISVPVLIMHAQDDEKIDFRLGMKLYKETISNPATKSPFIRFIRIHERHRVQHYTAKHPEVQTIFLKFLDDVMKFKGQDAATLVDGVTSGLQQDKATLRATKSEPVFDLHDY